VYEDAERDLAEVVSSDDQVTSAAINKIAGNGERVALFNSNSHPRREVAELGGELQIVEAPACGWAVHVPHAEDERVSVSDRAMENDLLRVELDEQGVLTSIWDKEADREVLSSRGNLLQLHDDNPKRWDAWDIDLEHRDTAVDITDCHDLRVESSHPLRAAIALTRRFGRSVIHQRISLDAGSRVLRVESTIDWQEEHKFLKVAFPVTVTSREATYEIQFGHVRRPTHMETSRARAMFEVCAQRWADLGDQDYGVSLLNDCKHGYDIHGSVMRLSLLRAPTHPDPTADRGHHRFAYALMPHPGDFREAGVIQAAEDLNAPLRIGTTDLPGGQSRSLLEVDTPQVIVEAIKRAEDTDATIVRLYEAWGRRCTARLRTTLPASRAFLCDLLERNREEVEIHAGLIELVLTPFKIVTIKLE
jgi:alpha-mannosidase